jgi:hypothetical protein
MGDESIAHGNRRSVLSLKQKMKAVIDSNDLAKLETLVAEEPRTLRFLIKLMYDLDEKRRSFGVAGIRMVAKYHPKQTETLVRRLIWAMGGDSGAYVPNAPQVLMAIAEESPELIVPHTSELVQLSNDANLKEGVCGILRSVVSRCPGKIGRVMSDSLKKRYLEGEGCGHSRDR